MAVQLPTFADLPSLVPQPSGALPSFKPNDPVAEGEANLGIGIQKAGLAASDTDLYQQLAKDKLEEANATVDLFSRVDPLKAQIAKETDPAKVAELKAQANDLLNTSGQAIANPLRRQMWTAQHTRTIGQLGVEADTRNTVLGREQAVADLHGMADKAIRTAVGSDDPQAMDIAQGAINDAAQYGRQYGAITPDQAYTFTKQRQAQLYVGKADRLLDQGNAGGANALLEQHRGDLDPIALERLQLRINRVKEKQGVVADTNALWGGADKGYTGNRATSAPYDTSGAPDQVDNAEVRTNNFGGMRKPGVPVGGGPQSNPGGWQQFDTPEAGVAAISHQLDRYASGATTGAPLTTIRQIVSTWAPASDNNPTNALISRAAKIVGADPDQPLDLSDPSTKAKLIEATIRNEQGGKLPVSPAIIAKVAGFGGTQVAQAGPQTMTDASPAGLVEPGNIDLTKRPIVKNADGSISTVKSMSFNEDGKEVLIPTVAADGSGILSNEAAIAQYRKTGQFLGKFDTPDNATAYAQQLHNSQAQQYGQSQGGPAPFRDINALAQQAQDKADSGEWTQEHANAVQAALRSRYNHAQAAQANDRATLTRQLNNGAAMLADGRDFDFDPAQIQHFFPKDKADEIIQQLQDAKDAGQITAGVRTSSPEDLVRQRQQFEAGMNDPNATDYAKRRKLLNDFQTAADRHFKELDKDPAAYVTLYSPSVAAKFQAIDPKKPETFAAYADAALAEQQRLGVQDEKRSILPSSVASSMAAKIAAIDPAKENPAAVLDATARSYGAYWPQVFGDLVKAKLPASYQVLAAMDRPEQAVAAGDLTRALGLISEKGGMSALKKAVPDDTQKAIDKGLDESLADFRASTGSQAGGARLYATVRDASQALAYYYGFRGRSDSEAVRQAVDGIITAKYDFGTIDAEQVRVPKGTLSDVEKAAGVVKSGINAEQLGDIPGNPLIPPEKRKEIWLGAIQAGGWANNEDDSGLVLMGRFRDGRYSAVRRADGSRIDLKFANAPALAAYAPEPPAPAYNGP